MEASIDESLDRTRDRSQPIRVRCPADGIGADRQLGGAVRGGRILADWPGLAPEALFEGRDLRPTTDLRSVFKTVLRDHLQVPQRHIDREVFPEAQSVPFLAHLVAG
ncbi:MAG: hypothetical protein EBZ40_08770 [Gammaproteobacteria bacterium]|nr:hypothetical protein [Gammaproteobacteria bacterium]